MKNSLLPIFRKIFRPSTVFLLFVFLTVNAYSQTGLEQVLSSVLKNSDALNANKKYWEAKRAENKSSMSLENPTLEYDYLFGYPAGSGNLTEFAITQQFDFPTAYGRKKELFRQQQKLSELSQQAYRQEILLRAKLIYLEMVWLNRKQHLINERSVRTQEFVFNYQEKLDKGAATILEVNKAKLQLLNIRKDSSLNQQEINARLTQLAELNGGQWITVTDTLYPAEIISEDFNLLDSMINANDPLIALYAQEAAVLKQHVALQKSLNLPKLEAGYHSQRQFPQSFRGIHAGISIPLWEGKNKLKATRLEQAHAEDLVRVQRLESRSQNRQLYETVKVRQRSLEEYKAILGSMNTRYLLDKSLRLGEIDLTSYFKEENEYYDAYEDFLRIEFEYHEAVARLRRYQL